MGRCKSVELTEPMSSLPILIVIPARLGSSRLPQKMLADINGKPMLQWVYEACQRAGDGFLVQIAVDSPELIEACAAFGVSALLTSDAHESGSSRCLEAWQQLNSLGQRFQGLINVQGDEPFLEPTLLQHMGNFMRSNQHTIVTAASPFLNPEEMKDPNCVKVGFSKQDCRAVYFSRTAPNPGGDALEPQTNTPDVIFKHLGIYGFPAALPLASILGASSANSDRERLEQLAWLDAGLSIHVLAVAPSFGGVDSAQDLARARAYAAGRIHS